MNFTREPIIETIVTPKEGSKLVVRNSKGGGQEEYLVDAVEVVSFGHSFFFRSMERPKCFLVPVSDYEVVEVKETRVALKNVSHERAIKIGGGREPSRSTREPAHERVPEPAAQEEEAGSADEAVGASASTDPRLDKKRDRRRHRRRRSPDERPPERQKRAEDSSKQGDAEATEVADEGGGSDDETQVSSSTFSKLFPPPKTLISQTMARYKDLGIIEEPVSTKPVEEKIEPVKDEEKKESEKKKSEENDNGTDVQQLSRASLSDEDTSYETQFLS